MRLALNDGDREYHLEVHNPGDGFVVTLGGRKLLVEVLAAARGEIDLRLDGKRHRVFVAARGDERFVFLAGKVSTFRLPADDPADSPEDTGGGPHLFSQMPGTVVKLLAAAGQEVAVGQGLLIMESMKMETEIAAPVAGRVTAVHVESGQTVGMGDRLIDIEPADSGE